MKTLASRFLLNAIIGLTFAATALADPLIKVNGFLDAGISWQQGSGSSFKVKDGALYLSHENGSASALIDIPFSASPTDFAIGQSKAQAWAEVRYANGFRWKLGQFDTIYGFEANDSADLSLTAPGAVFNNILPKVHRGLLTGYDLGREIGIHLFVADSMNALTTNPEFGTQVFFKPEGLRILAGAQFQMFDKGLTYLMDYLVGMDFGPLSVDVSFDMKKTYIMRIDASEEIRQVAENSLGLVGNLGYKINDTTSVALRGEYLSIRGTQSVITASVGPSFQMTQNFKVKFDYGLMNTTPNSGDSALTHRVGLSGVYRL